jgi:hypothetical protein
MRRAAPLGPTGPSAHAPQAGTACSVQTPTCASSTASIRTVYELVYQARDPIVMGLAYAVTRDIGWFERYQAKDDAGNPNPLRTSGIDIRRAYVSGTSSTGMYMRDFIYLGCNEDEQDRKVSDGASIYSAATQHSTALPPHASAHLHDCENLTPRSCSSISSAMLPLSA